MSKYRVTEMIKNTWMQTGGLIPTYLAAMILNVSMPRINQIWKERNLKKYSFEDKKRDLLSFNDVIKILEERNKVFRRYSMMDEEKGVIIEAKVLERKPINDKDALEKTIEAAKEFIKELQAEIKD